VGDGGTLREAHEAASAREAQDVALATPVDRRTREALDQRHVPEQPPLATPEGPVTSRQDPGRGPLEEHELRHERLDLRHGPCTAGYLGIYGEIDISLDTFPCTGGVTTCESLWMGVPVLSLCGVRPVARNTAAHLTHVGLTDWVAQTPEQYVDLVVRVEKELDQLAQLRAGLRDRMVATLCDARRFTRVLEEAYRSMWRRWCSSGLARSRIQKS